MSNNKIIESIRAIAKNADTTSVMCKVIDIDLENYTIDCEAMSDTEPDIYNVKLIADSTKKGFILFPKLESIVIVSYIDSGVAYCSMVSEVDNIFINGDDLDGLVKVNDLVTKINIVENKINSLITAVNAWIPAPNDGGAALKVSIASWLSTALTNTVKSDLENVKVKQGTGI